ncbi:MAG: nicotinate-nucleotide adenylyltransferase [Planctomycetota bacterium]
MAERIGLYGGSFNPIHHGHLILARAVGEQLNLQRVIFLPSVRPPHKDPSDDADAVHRAEMVRLAISGEALFEFSDFDLTRPGPTYTIDTVFHFRTVYGADVELYWLIGADSLNDLATWHRIKELVNTCRIVTAARPGVGTFEWKRLVAKIGQEHVSRLRSGILATPEIAISSSEIRLRVQRGESIHELVPPHVEEYIQEHGLYGLPGVS